MESKDYRKTNFFMTWKDLIITPLVEFLVLGIAAVTVALLGHHWHLGIADIVILFFIAQVFLTLITLKILRTICPLIEGEFSESEHENVLYSWKLQSFLWVTNLGYQQLFLPPILRIPFYKLLGATIGGGIVSIGGLITEPSLVTIEENVVLGAFSLLLSHAISVTPSSKKVLILGKIRIEKGALVGVSCIVMPGVVIGENAMVKAMSLVTMNTKIPKNEIWGGVPARKLGELVSNNDSL